MSRICESRLLFDEGRHFGHLFSVDDNLHANNGDCCFLFGQEKMVRSSRFALSGFLMSCYGHLRIAISEAAGAALFRQSRIIGN
jgi:hypothetical protein